MIGHSVVEPFESENPGVRKLQDELNGLNKAFDESVIFYPEAYAEAKVSMQPGSLDHIEGILAGVHANMTKMDQKLKVQNKTRKRENALFTEEEEILEAIYEDLGDRLVSIQPDSGSEQLKMDKIKIFRYNIVKMIYLLGGIALVSKTLYDLTQ